MSRPHYPRDLVGYGRTTPDPQWPGGAAIALQLVVNYEEGGENCILHGDAASEAFLSEIVGAQPWPGQRHMNMESIYEYGARARVGSRRATYRDVAARASRHARHPAITSLECLPRSNTFETGRSGVKPANQGSPGLGSGNLSTPEIPMQIRGLHRAIYRGARLSSRIEAKERSDAAKRSEERRVLVDRWLQARRDGSPACRHAGNRVRSASTAPGRGSLAMMRRSHWIAAAAFAAFSLAPHPASAQSPSRAVEPHALYESKCMGCHNEHGADLARQRLAIAGEKLQVGRTGAPLDRLLNRHYGVRLTPAELTALTRLFGSGIRWAGTFQRRCARCHETGVKFARSTLALRNGEVRTIRGDRDVAAFLTGGHGEATAAEITTLMEMLRYQLETAPK
jgi:hypothetical protein